VADHRIVRHAGSGPPARRGGLRPGEVPIAHFHRGPAAEDDPEVARDLGIALSGLTDRLPPDLRPVLGELAVPRLQAAVTRDAADLPAQEALGRALLVLGRLDEARAAFDAILGRVPRHEPALDHAANVAMAAGRPDDAAEFWRRALAEDPWRWQHRYGLAAAEARRGRWADAADQCQQALRRNPASRETRQLLVRCYLETGGPAAAEFERLLALFPADREALRRWFDERSK
jgi:tetratricopeptide (TPR) repeat protein